MQFKSNKLFQWEAGFGLVDYGCQPLGKANHEQTWRVIVVVKLMFSDEFFKQPKQGHF
jgi:hypothetical protein